MKLFPFRSSIQAFLPGRPVAHLWTTAYSPSQCLERLRKVSEPFRWFHQSFRKDRPPLELKEEGDSFWVAKNDPFGNFLRPIFMGRQESSGQGARVIGRFETHSLNFWLLAVWYLYLCYRLFFTAPEVSADFEKTWQFILVTAFLIALPTLIWALGTWLARGEEQFLLDALSEVLQSDPVVCDHKRDGGGGS